MWSVLLVGAACGIVLGTIIALCLTFSGDRPHQDDKWDFER